MKKALLVILMSLTITNLGSYKAYNVDMLETIENSNKRNYNYLSYTNNNNYYVTNQDDFKNAIYNGLNSGSDDITLYCKYDNNDDCLNDFYTIYKNKPLLSSINNYVNPYNKYKSTRYRINISNDHVTITLEIDKKYTQKQIDEIDRMLDTYLNELDINEMTDIEKVKWAHDFIINRNKYAKDSPNDTYSAYDAIINSKATCQGYTEAIAILLDKFNIPNIMISSNTHIWNLVKIDGKWLHLDTTWDDPIYSSGKEETLYDYYLVSSEQLANLDNSNSHKFNATYYLETLKN